MTCSPARLAANRANARKSTGPRTEEGKSRSRANALKHGLCSSVVVAEDYDRVQARVQDWFYTLKPQNEYHAWLVDKLAVYSLRIDRAERIERHLRDRRSLRAARAWDDDLRLQAEHLGGRIGSRPAGVVEELRRTPVGCDWLISRWAMLAHAADVQPDNLWTAEQTSLAFDLLGTPAEFRPGRRPGEVLDGRGRVVAEAEGNAAVARREIDALEARREEVADLDEVDRSLAEVDLFDESHAELKRLRRYEGALHNKLRWALGELRYVSPHLKPSPEMILRMVTSTEVPPISDAERPAPEAPPAPAPAPAKAVATAPTRPRSYGSWTIESLHPPFEIEPHEMPRDGSRPDLFGILLARQEKLERKAEVRREGRRRQLARLRA